MARDRVTINVGGTRFVTTSTTIANAGRDSMLSTLLDQDWRPKKPEEDELFIDRNPVYFAVLLDLLRTGELRIPPGMSQPALLREALFYGLAAHVRAASWHSPLDGNRVTLASSLNGRAAEYDGAALVRASPAGACCVCHGRVVHTYDWSLQEQQPVSLDMVLVRDAGFVAGERLVVCTYDRGDQIGGMACFNPSSGSLEHRFRLPLPGSGGSRNFSAAALASSREGKLFAVTSARNPSTSGIGTWDPETGQNSGFVPMPSSCCKLQWIEPTNLLLAASMYPEDESCHLWMLDHRAPPSQAAAVWEWSQGREDSVVMDVAATYGGVAICLVNQYDNLRFLDTRGSLPSQAGRWSKQFKQLKLSESEEHSYAKLRANPGCDSQIFCSRQDAVLVYSSSTSSDLKGMVPTSRLPISTGAGGCFCCCSKRDPGNDSSRSIADMDVGGDRLFVLHGEENVVDVWQTPLIL